MLKRIMQLTAAALLTLAAGTDAKKSDYGRFLLKVAEQAAGK